MSRILIVIVCITLLMSCNGRRPYQSNIDSTRIKDSINKRKAIDAQMALGDRPDSEQEEESFEEVKADLLKSYNEVKTVDTIVVDGKDNLHVYFKYYCLHDSALVIPKKYNWGEKNPKDFVTHNFANKILILNNKDTIFNKVITRADFDGILFEQLQKYAILFDPHFNGYNKSKGGLIFGYSITIPLTDVGTAAYLTVDKKGNSKFIDSFNWVNKK